MAGIDNKAGVPLPPGKEAEQQVQDSSNADDGNDNIE